MRYFTLLAGLLAFVFSSESLTAAEANTEKPNIVILLADDVDWKDFGCYGNDAIRTPEIDDLAKTGLLFQNAFLTTSSCSPTRISVLTGKYPHATGAEDLHMPLPKDEVFISTYLQKAGYHTGHMQKTHYGPNGDKQFQWYSKGSDIRPLIKEAGDKPFFLWVGFRDAHRPYKPNTVDPPHDPAKVKVPPYLADTPETRADLALYYDEITHMDEQIGDMKKALEEAGELDNTLIIFFSDNGRPFPRAKGTAYDSGLGTPLVMSWPKVIKAGGTHSGLASVVDLAPTVLDAAGVEIPQQMQGKSILPILKNPAQPGRKMVFGERNWHNADEHIRAVRTDRYKLIRNAYLDQPLGSPSDCSNSPSWDSLQELKAKGELTPEQMLLFVAPRPEFELYDLSQDPWEFNNLANDPKFAEKLGELQTALENWTKETDDFSPEKRRRADNVNRETGVKFTKEIAPQTNLK